MVVGCRRVAGQPEPLGRDEVARWSAARHAGVGSLGWDGDAILFSGGLRSRKIRNLLDDPRCSIATEDAHNPVVVEGVSTKVDEVAHKQSFLDLVNEKYDTDYELSLLDPESTAVMGVAPT